MENEVVELLDRFYEKLKHASSDIAELINDLSCGLNIILDNNSCTDLREFHDICRSHPIREIAKLDPYTKRALDKPRGYAGDAVMLDFIYRPEELSIDWMGEQIHKATTSSPNAQSILYRQRYISDLITKVSRTKSDARVLSIASGHMRELDLCASGVTKNLNLYALDQDKESLDELSRSYHEFNINLINSPVTHLFRSKSLGKFDLIYSAGLFDYLNDKIARKIINHSVNMLADNGVLVIGNFMPKCHGRGYMEAMMEWSLIYRSEDQLASLCPMPNTDLELRCFSDKLSNVAYIEIQKV